MLINPVNLISSVIGGLTSAHNVKQEKEISSLLANSKERQDESYDVRNMSLEDLQKMALNLFEAGKISDKEKEDFSLQSPLLQQLGGLAQDSKTDMLQLYQQQLDAMKVQYPQGNKNIASFERSLELLKGVQAGSGAVIPKSV